MERTPAQAFTAPRVRPLLAKRQPERTPCPNRAENRSSSCATSSTVAKRSCSRRCAQKGDTSAPSEEPHSQVEAPGEQGEQRIREALVQAEQERDVDELRQIAAAKERMARGGYGECLDCGVDIPLARL
jgi:RNA polymerase-binding transcription factor DksA